jgi:plasmid stabilization system protein ParE
MIRVRFHEEAEDDFLDAIRYYADRSRTVASRFVQEVRYSGPQLLSSWLHGASAAGNQAASSLASSGRWGR